MTENYRAVFRALSRHEAAQVVILAYPGLGQHARTGKAPELRRRFMADMRHAAEEHRFNWVDLVPVFEEREDAVMKIDDLHFSAAGHALIAAAVAGAIASPAPRR